MTAVALELLALMLVAGLLGCVGGCYLRRWIADAAAKRAARADEREGHSLTHASERLREASSFVPKAPDMLPEPELGPPSDLKKIKGLGKIVEDSLNEMGIFYFRQIADWSRSNVRWIEQKLILKGRIDRETWVPQARKLAAEETRAQVKARFSDDAGGPPAGRVETPVAPARAGDRKKAPEPESDPQIEVLTAPRDGAADDLKKISGIGAKLEKKLNEHGVYHYDQIAGWTKAQIGHVDGLLDFKGRIDRDRWCEQAKRLAQEAYRPAVREDVTGGKADAEPDSD